MGNFFHSGHLVGILADGLFEVTGDLNTDVACTICFLDIGDWVTPSPVGWSTQVITPMHSILSRCSLTFGHVWWWGNSWGQCMMGWMSWWSWIGALIRESANPCESIWKLLNQVISGLDGLGCCCCGSRCRAWRFGVRLGQLWWHSSSLQLLTFCMTGRPRMAGPGVSAWHTSKSVPCSSQAPGSPGHQVMGPWSAPYRDIWDPLYAVSLVLTCNPGQWAGHLGWSGLGRDVWIHRGATHYLQLQCQPWHAKWGCFLAAGTCRQLYHCIGFTALWGMDVVYHYLLWVSNSYEFHSQLHQCTVCHDVGASSALTLGWVVAMVDASLAWTP